MYTYMVHIYDQYHVRYADPAGHVTPVPYVVCQTLTFVIFFLFSSFLGLVFTGIERRNISVDELTACALYDSSMAYHYNYYCYHYYCSLVLARSKIIGSTKTLGSAWRLQKKLTRFITQSPDTPFGTKPIIPSYAIFSANCMWLLSIVE